MKCKSAEYFPAYSLRDTVSSKVIFTMGFQPSCHAIPRKHTLHSHLVWKLCRFHGPRYQGKQGEKVREREKKEEINRVAAWSLCFYASKALFWKVGEGSGNEAMEVGEFFDRRFRDLARLINQMPPSPARRNSTITTSRLSSFCRLSLPQTHPHSDLMGWQIVCLFCLFGFQMEDLCHIWW